MKTPAAETDLFDVNVWLALAAEDHVHHKRARKYWESEAGQEVAFCRVTMLGFLRLATNSTVMAGRPFSVAEAWALYRGFRSEPGVVVLAEPGGLEEQMASWSALPAFSPSRWTDCALAAWAKGTGARIVSFDGDYKVFAGLSFLHLKG